MKTVKLIPETEIYFEYNRKITKGIFKGIQTTSSGKFVKRRNRLVEITNKYGNASIIIIPKETKFFYTEKDLIESKEKLIIADKHKKELAQQKYINNMNKIKNDLSKIKNINELQIFNEIDWNERDYYTEIFDRNYDFILKDGTKIKMTKNEYRCILHNLVDISGVDIYEIDNGELFKCFDCGILLVNRDDLIKKYDIKKEINDKFLFPKFWSENKIIKWIKKYLHCLTNNSSEYM